MLTDLEKNAIRDHYQNIGKSLPGFRPRAAQREMIAAIANAFSRSQSRAEGEEAPKREGESIAVIEGPTGVGKSLAYLLAGGLARAIGAPGSTFFGGAFGAGNDVCAGQRARPLFVPL